MMMKKSEMKIQYVHDTFGNIAKANGIEVKRVAEKDYSEVLDIYHHATVYEYISQTGDIVTVVETGTGNYTDGVVIATISVPRKLTEKETFECVCAVEREY
jgi:hypothetical protein